MSVATPNTPCPHKEDLEQLQPFGDDVCTSWMQVAQSIDFHPTQLLRLSSPAKEKRVMMLGAPRAGFGKTHLLGQWVASSKQDRLFLALPWEDAESLQWLATAHGLISNLSKTGQASEDLRAVAAGIMTSLLAHAIRRGKVPCGNPEVAARLITQDPLAVFGDDGEIQAISQWFRRNFLQLVEVMASESGIEPKEKVVIWLRRLFEYALHPTPDNDSRLVALLLEDQPKQLMMFLKLITLYKPVVLIADHMDALFGRHLAGVTVASFSVALASLPLVDVVLCVNHDLWEVTFEQQLPSALKDRLDANPILMEALTLEESSALVAHRLTKAKVPDALSRSFEQALQLARWFSSPSAPGLSPRSVLRLCAQAWPLWLAQRPIPGPEETGGQDDELRFLDERDLSIQKLRDSLKIEAFEEEVSLVRKPFAPVLETLEEAHHHANATQGFLLEVEEPAVISPQVITPPSPVHETVSAVFASPEPVAERPVEDFLSEVPAPAQEETPEPETPPEVQGANPHLQELRNMLSKLNRSVTAPAEAVSESNHSQATVPSDRMASSSLERFYRARLSAPSAKEFIVHPDWWEQVLPMSVQGVAGYNFHQIASPSFPDSKLFSWISEDEEVYFGIEAADERNYWKFVATYLVGRRVELDRKTSILNPKLGKAKLRLIKLATNGDTSTSADCLREMGMLGMTAKRVLQSFATVDVEDRCLLKMNALSAVQRQAFEGKVEVDAAEWEKLLAAELDSFRESVLKIEPQEPAAGEVA